MCKTCRLKETFQSLGRVNNLLITLVENCADPYLTREQATECHVERVFVVGFCRVVFAVRTQGRLCRGSRLPTPRGTASAPAGGNAGEPSVRDAQLFPDIGEQLKLLLYNRV